MTLITVIQLLLFFNNSVESKPVLLTGYSSEITQTDETPFLAKCGPVKKCTIALSRDLFKLGLRCHQKVILLFDDIDTTCLYQYTINDTMHKRKLIQADMWKSLKLEALQIGRSKGFLIWRKTK